MDVTNLAFEVYDMISMLVVREDDLIAPKLQSNDMNEKYYENPRKFKPERWVYRHIIFQAARGTVLVSIFQRLSFRRLSIKDELKELFEFDLYLK